MDARERLAGWRDEAIGRGEGLRPVARESLHVTLVFLGYVPEEDIAATAAIALEPAAGDPAPWLVPGEVTAIPPRRPRLLALDLDDRGLRATALAAGASERLVAAGLHRPEGRSFWPHLTLARVTRGARAMSLENLPPPPPAGFEAPRLTLYRSTLRPQGARYEPLAHAALHTVRPGV